MVSGWPCNAVQQTVLWLCALVSHHYDDSEIKIEGEMTKGREERKTETHGSS